MLDGDLPNDPYASYLLWPHFHFSGTYRADASTVNNMAPMYDTEHYVAGQNLVLNWNNYNPKGSHEWSVNGFVTNVCYANGTCVGDDEKDKDAEPLVGTPIKGMDTIYTIFPTDRPMGTLPYINYISAIRSCGFEPFWSEIKGSCEPPREYGTLF